MATEQNQAGGPGGEAQDRQPNLEELHPSGEEIINGARNEDQLDGMRESATLTTEGDMEDQEENLGGTTNLSLDQLKAEGDNNDRISNLDDLNEIRANDDLNEPDPEASYQATNDATLDTPNLGDDEKGNGQINI